MLKDCPRSFPGVGFFAELQYPVANIIGTESRSLASFEDATFPTTLYSKSIVIDVITTDD